MTRKFSRNAGGQSARVSRYAKGRASLRMARKLLTSKIHRFTRVSSGCYDYVSSANVLNMVSTVGGNNYSFIFRLQDLPNYTEFSNLFDQYRIKKVKVMFLPQQTDNLTTGGAQTTAVLMSAIDTNDASSTSTEADMLQYERVKMHKFNEKFTVTVVPRLNVPIYTNTVFTGYGLGKAGQWVNTGDPDVVYYCLKVLIPGCTATALSGWRIYVKYFLECKNLI